MAEAEDVVDRFAPEMERYCELLYGPGGRPFGLMFRGEGPQFTARVQRQLRAWRMPNEGLAHYASLVELFEHKRAFLKLEWQQAEQIGQDDHLVAVYFRRRPAVRKIMEYLHRHGVQVDILEQAAHLAQLLEKDSVHFVSAAMCPGQAVRHKLYFSQYVTPERADAVLTRLFEVLTWFEIDTEVRARWARHHHKFIPADRVTTIFVSLSFENNLLVPSIKIDYPNVSPQIAAMLLPTPERPGAEAEMEGLCTLTGIENLSYLGVRLQRTGPLSLKYYADFET